VIIAGLLVASCGTSSSTPSPTHSADTSHASPTPETTKKSCRTGSAPTQESNGTVRSELRIAALRFVDLARGHVDCRLADPLPVDTPIGLYLGNHHEHTIPEDAISARSEWNMCAPGYGPSCPVSPLNSIATLRGKPAISYRLPRECLTTLAGRPSDLGGSHMVVVHPAKPQSCASNFAVELWMNDDGQIDSVNLLLNR
jgi:hypothetical protein